MESMEKFPGVTRTNEGRCEGRLLAQMSGCSSFVYNELKFVIVPPDSLLSRIVQFLLLLSV